MSAITFSVDFTGTPDEYDRAGAQFVIDSENARITAANEQAAQEDPPGPQLPLLPDSTAGEIKTSYLGQLTKAIDNAHDNYVKAARQNELETQVRSAWTNATDAQRAAALAALQ